MSLQNGRLIMWMMLLGALLSMSWLNMQVSYFFPSFKYVTINISSVLLNSILDIVFIGPIGSGKSSLIGSLSRAVNDELRFPDRIQLTLNHPDEDKHGTIHWMETQGNPKGTVIYQDTRGDQVIWGAMCNCNGSQSIDVA